MNKKEHPLLRVLRMRHLPERTGLSRSTLFALMNPKSPQYDPAFPPRIFLTQRCVGFSEQAVDAWIAARTQGLGGRDD